MMSASNSSHRTRMRAARTGSILRPSAPGSCSKRSSWRRVRSTYRRRSPWLAFSGRGRSSNIWGAGDIGRLLVDRKTIAERPSPHKKTRSRFDPNWDSGGCRHSFGRTDLAFPVGAMGMPKRSLGETYATWNCFSSSLNTLLVVFRTCDPHHYE